MKELTIVLVGQPNVGKSSIINKMCGSNLKVGNFAGVTIEKAQAQFSYKNHRITIIDLPGTYSLNQYSPEEKITQDFLLHGNYDVILNVADCTNLERNLALNAQLLELERKIILALNMKDEAQNEGIEINERLLSDILGIPCLKVTSKSQADMYQLLDAILLLLSKPTCPSKRTYSQPIEDALKTLETFLSQKKFPCVDSLLLQNGVKKWKSQPPYTQSCFLQNTISYRKLCLLLLQQDQKLYTQLSNKPCWSELSALLLKLTTKICKQLGENEIRNIFTLEHYAYAKGAALEVQKQSKSPIDRTQKLDQIFLNKYAGIPIFLFLMWLLFQATFTLGSAPKDWIDSGFVWLGDTLKEHISNASIASLLSDGVIGGVGAVMSFLPDILILFLGIVLLESTGYMARIAFLLDGFFHKFGLHGKSFIPLVTGFGCSVPAYMSTRMLKNRSDKMLTLFIINFMSCSARLPVYVLFVGAFFSEAQSGNILFAIYLLGALVGLLMAKILKLTAFRGIDEPFVMEMPKYRLPSLKLVTFSVWNKAKMYLRKAGTFILVASIGIWFASQYPTNANLIDPIDEKITALQNDSNNADLILQLENQKHALLLEYSYLGRFGEFISPIFKPFEFDWKLSVSLVTGIAAKEVMISTMGVLYALGEDLDETSQTLMKALHKNVSIPSAIAFILFVMFYNPCFAATIVFAKEAGGKKYIFYLFAFTSIVAYFFAFIGYYTTSIFF